MQVVERLTTAERADYLRYKFQAKNGLEEAIRAIEIIRDRRLYREEYHTFEDFCQGEFSKTRGRINQLIRATNLDTNGIQLSERAARELVSLSPEQQRDVLAIATATAPGGNVTASWIKSTRTTLETAAATGGYVDVGDGKMSALSAAITGEEYERAQRQREHIQEGRPPKLASFEATLGALDQDLTLVLNYETLSQIVQLFEAGTLGEGQIVRVLIYEVPTNGKA